MRKPRSIKKDDAVEISETQVPKIKPIVSKTQLTTLKSFVEYCNGNEVFSFETQSEATEFGEKLRILAKGEEGAKSIYDLEKFDISVGALTVRIKITEQS